MSYISHMLRLYSLQDETRRHTSLSMDALYTSLTNSSRSRSFPLNSLFLPSGMLLLSRLLRSGDTFDHLHRRLLFLLISTAICLPFLRSFLLLYISLPVVGILLLLLDQTLLLFFWQTFLQSLPLHYSL